MLMYGTGAMALLILSFAKASSAPSSQRDSVANTSSVAYINPALNNLLNPVSAYWAVESTFATTSYCQIMPDNGCVMMGHGQHGLCEVTALRTMIVRTKPAGALNLVKINGKMMHSIRGMVALNRGDKVTCRQCTDCMKDETAVQMCATKIEMTYRALSSSKEKVACTDNVLNWTDTNGRGCSHYSRMSWCNRSKASSLRGQAPGAAVAKRVCCECGGGERRDGTDVTKGVTEKPTDVPLVALVVTFGLLAFVLCPAVFVAICCWFFRKMQAERELDDEERDVEMEGLRREVTLVRDILESKEDVFKKNDVAATPCPPPNPSNLVQRRQRQQRREQRRRRQQQLQQEQQAQKPGASEKKLAGPGTNEKKNSNSKKPPEGGDKEAKNSGKRAASSPSPLDIVSATTPRASASAKVAQEKSTESAKAPATEERSSSAASSAPAESQNTVQKATESNSNSQKSSVAKSSIEKPAASASKGPQRSTASHSKGKGKSSIISDTAKKTLLKRLAAANDRDGSDDSEDDSKIIHFSCIDSDDDSEPISWTKERLRNFLLAHNQSDLADQVPQILRRHRGRERELFNELEDKFGGSLNDYVYVHQDKFSDRNQHSQLEY